MKFTMTSPCGNCPFRSDKPFFLAEGRAEEITNNLLSGGTFPCHKTVDYDHPDDEDGEGVVTDDSIHCAGALIMLEKMESPSQMMRIAERLGMYDRTKLKMDAPVYDSADEMIETIEALND